MSENNSGGFLMPRKIGLVPFVGTVVFLSGLVAHAAVLEYRFQKVESSQQREEKSIRRIEQVLCLWCKEMSHDRARCFDICVTEEKK